MLLSLDAQKRVEWSSVMTDYYKFSSGEADEDCKLYNL